MEEFRKKLEEIHADVIQTRESQIEIQKDLEYHIKRTDLLEESVEKVYEDKIKPMFKWFSAFDVMWKLVGVLAVIGGLILTFNRLNATELPIDSVLRQIQSNVPCKLRVHSKHRTPDHNKRVGGVKNSYHLSGRAADISASCLSHHKLANIANKYSTVILYKTHVHVDMREPKICLVKVRKWFTYCKEL